ncbi:MAG: hypothetical protein JNJ54_19025 [Myxococcaceae bacterium]|nr:hypothetical protein [Myxococcaceae bacterium]
MARALLAVMVVGLCGCPEKKAIDESDPLIRKLKAEQDRLDKGGLPGGPPGVTPPKPSADPLAELTQQPPDMPVNVTIKTAPVSAGEVTITPKRLETAQIVAGPKVKLSTTDRFLRLVITVSSAKDASFDLAKANLRRGGDTFELARDVQRVGQGSPLASTIAAGVPQDLVLYFELPPASLGPGLTLVLPGPVELEVPLL